MRTFGNYLLKLLSIIATLVFTSCDNQPESNYNVQEPFVIEVTGEQYHWQIRYPGKDGELHTEDDITDAGNIYAPCDKKIHIHLKSKDFLYFVNIPELNINGMAVPGLSHVIKMDEMSNSILQFRGHQMCGYAHQSLIKKIIIESENQLIKRLRSIEK